MARTGGVHGDQLPLDFAISTSQRHRREQQRLAGQLHGEQTTMFVFTPPDLDVHLHSPYEAVATLGGDAETSRRWLESVVGPVQQVKGRKFSFPVSTLDRLLSVRPPARVTLDAACLAVARALWANALGLKPIKVFRKGRRILASSGRWPAGMTVTDAPWTSVAALIALDVPIQVDESAAGVLADKLATTGQAIARAGLAGSAVYIETNQPQLVEQLGLPALAYAGGPGTGRYRMPVLAAEKLLYEPTVRLSDEARAAIKRATGRVKKAETPEGFPWTLYDFQARDAARGLRILETAGGVLLAGDMGSGKSVPDGTRVYGPAGPVRIRDLCVGDEVFGRDGKPHRVTGVFPQGTLAVFEITFADRTSIKASGDHLWYVESPVQKRRGRPGKVLTTLELLAGGLRDGAGNCRWFVPIVEPLQFADRGECRIPGYLLGVLLGAGSLSSSSIALHNVEPDIGALVQAELDREPRYRGMSLVAPKEGDITWRFNGLPDRGGNPLRDDLDAYGLRGKRAWGRWVPEAYLYGPVEQRVAVLQGLLDTDGGTKNARQRSSIEFSSTSEQLADDVCWLVRSLGGVARKCAKPRPTTYTHNGERKRVRPSWRVTITWNDTLGRPFRCARKAAEYKPRAKHKPARAIVSIEPAGEAECVCISVDAPDKLFVTEHATPTHNTTVSLACAAILDTFPLLVVSPLAAFSTWARQLGEMGKSFYLASEAPVVSWEKIASQEHDAIVISYDRLHAFVELLETMPFKAIIADELQRISSPGSRRSRALRQLAQAFPLRIGLSGTPMSNTLGDLLPLGAFLVPGEWQPRANAKDLADLYPGDPVEAVAEHLGTLMVRRRIDQVGVKLPEKNVRRVYVQLTAEQRRALENLEREAAEEVEGGGVTKIHVFAKLQKMRQIVGCPSAAGVPGPNPKVRTAVDLAEEFADQGRKSVLFCANRQTWIELGKACDEAGLPWVGIWGSSTVPERLEAERRYHNDPNIKVFIGTLQSCAESLTLSPTGTAWISCDYLYNPSALAQAEARVYRLNQTNPVEIIYLHASVPGGSLDDRMVEILDQKRSLFAQVVDRTQHVDPTQVHYSLGDLVYLLTGKRDETIDQREADAKEAIAREQKAKANAKATAHKRKYRNRSDVVRDDGSQTMTLEEMRALGRVASEVDIDDESLDAHIGDEDGLEDVLDLFDDTDDGFDTGDDS